MNAPELRRASFRGVSFEFTSSNITVGRRTQTFEYPQRDIPFTEDLGRSKRTITIDAFVSGADYITRMKRLIAACEKQGSGRLVHPWLGTLEVTPTTLSSPTFDTNRIASVKLMFVESGKLAFPNSFIDGSSLCVAAANKLLQVVSSEFTQNFDLSKVQDFVKNTVGLDAAELFSDSRIESICRIFETADDLATLANDAITLVGGSPADLMNRVLDVLGLQSAASAVHAWTDVTNRLSLLVRDDNLNSAKPEAIASQTTSRKIEDSEGQIQSLVRGVMLANAVTAASYVGTDSDRTDESAPVKTPAYDDLIRVRNNLLEALDEEILKTTNNEVYEALYAARSAVYEVITQKAENQARLVTFTPSSVTPALVLAYDYYGDSSRELEIVERNKIKHSGFVPAIELKLLNE